jgi:hypothetical protein
MSDAKPRYSILDLGPEAQVSDPVEIKIRGKQIVGVFREISQDTKDRLRLEAAAYAQTLKAGAEDTDGNRLDPAWLQEHLDVVLSNRWTALMLHAALRDPDDHAQPLFGHDVLAQLPTGTITDLALKYEQFESGVSALNVTSEDVEEFIAELKKKTPPHVLWRRYGSSIQLACLRHLVDLLETPQTDTSSDT